MKKFLLLFVPLAFLFNIPVVLAQSTYLTDYNFQIDQYRRSLAEYLNFKNDYDNRPSLNNEQKAIISAKQTIVARELTRANFYLALAESVGKPAVNYPLINQSLLDLRNISDYHFSQAKKVDAVVTRTDLTNFTKEELVQLEKERLPVTKAQVANKLAQMIKFQIDAKAAYDYLIPKLETVKNEVVVKNGLDQVQTYSGQINEQIESLAKLTTEFDLSRGNQNQFYEDATEILKEIRALQNRLISIIIDLDTNYVHR